MKILSLFNGCSGAYLGAIQAGFEVTEYHYSEIDKHANKVTDYNIPFALNLGDVRNVKGGDYDLCIFGSPCQGFSIAGNRLNFADPRSMLFFEAVRILRECQKVNPKIYWIMENVASMDKDIKTAISRELGINPIKINSALVSAQNRQRYYWTNICSVQHGLFDGLVCGIPQPADRGIYLRDILQPSHEVPEKYDMSVKSLERIFRKKYSNPAINPEKTGTLNTKNNSAQVSFDSGTTLIARQYGNGNGNYIGESLVIDKDGNEKRIQDKASCITGGGHSGGNHSDMDVPVTNGIECINPTAEDKQTYQQDRIYTENTKLPSLLSELSGRNFCIHAAAIRGRSEANPNDRRAGIELHQTIELNGTGKTNTLTSVEKDNVVITCHNLFPRSSTTGKGGTGLLSRSDGKAYCLNTGNVNALEIHNKLNFKHLYKHQPEVLLEMVLNKQVRIRRLTPVEVTRLQTMPDGWFYDKEGLQLVSDSQIYKMTGNGFTSEVIAHILRHIPKQ